MSDQPGVFSGIAQAIVDPIEQHRRLPPDQKRLAQVSLASHALGWCLYFCPFIKSGPFPVAVLFGAAFFGNGHPPDWVLPVGAWGGVTAISVLWLLAAWRSVEACRELGKAFGRLMLAASMAALLWFRVYPDWGPLVELILKGFYLAWGFSHVCRFLLAAQLFGGTSAERIIQKILKRRNAGLVPVGAGRSRRLLFLVAVALIGGAAAWFLL
jgi:hypothetical protein